MSPAQIKEMAEKFCTTYRPSLPQQTMIEDGMPPSLARDPNEPRQAPPAKQEKTTMGKPANLPILSNALNTAFGQPAKASVHIDDLHKSTHPLAKANADSWKKENGGPVAKTKKKGKSKAKKAAPKAAKPPAPKKAAKPAPNKTKAPTATAANAKAAPKTGRKAEVSGMMKNAAGTTVEKICKATGMLPHSARALISGIAKAEKVETSKEPGEATVYRIKG